MFLRDFQELIILSAQMKQNYYNDVVSRFFTALLEYMRGLEPHYNRNDTLRPREYVTKRHSWNGRLLAVATYYKY